ncbi:hypothetical protein [Methylobacterium brachiatum]|uniref:hypothetical protein n=1 Tax=Methylobacterium brachiatum TaxID=269660 RepID=UPI000EFB7BF7|nr:hypothetical protein [Methylobacterium brachiatum]AYO83560.1 hypothetical protein EBB05_15655 [Methylobacterium brachiatum]
MTRADVQAILPRVRTFTGVCNSSGVATISFGAGTYAVAPFAWLIEDWTAGNQMICGKVTAVTATSCTVQGMVSVGTLLLNAAPFTTAPSGTVVTVAVLA